MSGSTQPAVAPQASAAPIAGRYLVDATRILPDLGGGIPAYAATGNGEGGTPLMALPVRRHAPARARALGGFGPPIDGLSVPLAHGPGPPVDGRPAWYVICAAPPGAPLANNPRQWPEPLLIELVLRPVAHILEQLQARGLTHRAIRPNNVFQTQPNRPVTLGAAWAAPPAMHQPAVFEPPNSALCHPAGRGDGGIADDVYALGVLLVTLALGRVPLEGLDDAAIRYRKLELGDFGAIAGGERLPPLLTDLVRGMLAEDPDHRPTPTLLRDPSAARGRRVASRPPSRAQRSLKLGSVTVWNTRTLAHAMATEPEEALTAIHDGQLMYWLRRGLGDANLAVKLEELVRQSSLDVMTDRSVANATLVMRAIVDADVMMPLCWRGLAIWPDGLGSMLAVALASRPGQSGAPAEGSDAAGADPALTRKLEEIVMTEAQGIWAAMREDREPAVPQRQEARQRRAIAQIRGIAGGLPRLSYTLNPLTPCASPLLGDRWITTVADLTPALDAIAAAAPNVNLLDPHIAAFIGARSDRSLDREVRAIATQGDGPDDASTALTLLTELQNRYHPAPLRGLTGWIVARAPLLVNRWKNRERRAEIEAKLKTLAAIGFLTPIRDLLEDKAGHAADSGGLLAARAELARLDAELRGIVEGGQQRSLLAARLGQEIAAGVGLAAIAATLILTAMG